MFANLRFQVGLLALMQALLLTNNVTLIAVNGLAGLQLADNKLLATLPVTGYVLGGAFWAMPAAAFMRRFGRRAGYTVGSIVAIAGAVLGWFALTVGSLWLLCLATFVCGLYNAFGASLRFAAADVADAYRPDFRARAISLVITGGIAGGIIGPTLSTWSRGWLPAQFAGTYLTLVGFAIASLLLAQLLRLPVAKQAAAVGAEAARPLAEILRQPACWVAIVCAALGYGVMNLLMVATPLAMEVCSLPYEDAAFVISWHVVGMFAPGLFTGALIARFGVLQVILAGCLLMLACVAIALSGVELMHFVWALFLLGVGWNFLFTGSTTLSLQTYTPAEKDRAQGALNFFVFAIAALSSFATGVLVSTQGRQLLNAGSLIPVALTGAAIVWLGTRPHAALPRVR
jgi:MFS family permease